MVVLYLEALVAIALSLAILMALAWVMQQRTGNSTWVDTIWTFSAGLTGAGSALWPVGGASANARQWLVAALVAIWSLRLGLHIAARSAGITDDPEIQLVPFPVSGRNFDKARQTSLLFDGSIDAR